MYRQKNEQIERLTDNKTNRQKDEQMKDEQIERCTDIKMNRYKDEQI